ncbi:MAG: hypothetical protein J5659_05030 [Clostridia bacterium]|nr:hypothetical protein [Clostridia bacterium]
MNLRNRIVSVFLLICIAVTLCACERGNFARIYLSVESMPDTLDPQVASSDSELMICRNIYEGLTRQNNKGEIVPAAAENYSFDGLTYIFTLRDNLKWSDGEPVIADDFVFGIKRALLPETRAPFARLLYAVTGAPEVHSGALGIDTLGISAPDDKTVKITLSYNDEGFLKALSMPVSMPCREKFFNESTGKYGLEKENIVCSGSYYLYRWNRAEFGIRLYVNDEYTGEFKAKNSGVFISRDKEKTVTEKLISGDSDIALISSKYLPDIIENKTVKTTSVGNICWVLSLGGELGVNIRRALCGCISTDIYGKDMPPGFSVAQSLFPDCLGQDTADISLVRYNPEEARAIISEEVKQFKNKKFPQTTLVYAESEPMRPVITRIVGDWQKNLSTFINIKSTDKTLTGELKEHSLPLSVFPVKADSTLEEYTYKFGEDYYNGYSLVPIAFEETTVGYSDDIRGVYMNATGGYLDFSYIVKK